jgi:hypothetical protein
MASHSLADLREQNFHDYSLLSQTGQTVDKTHALTYNFTQDGGRQTADDGRSIVRNLFFAPFANRLRSVPHE